MLNTFLNNIRGFYFFPIIIFSLSLLILKESNIFLLLCLFFVLLRVLFLKNKEIIFLSVLGLFLSFAIHIYYNQESNLPLMEDEELSLVLIPDTIQVDGDLAKFEALEKKTKEKVIVNYKLQSKEEKDIFLQLTKTYQLTGKATTQPIEVVRNLNGFDYKRYLDLNGVSQKIKLTEITSFEIEKVSIFQPIKKIKEIRRCAIVYTNYRFPTNIGSYMNALLFGYKENTPESFQGVWQKLGVAHLFSLSGMHIYFFIFIFEWLFLVAGLTKEKLYYLSIIFVFILVVMTGLGTGMVRAGIQWLIKQMNDKYKWHLSLLDCWSIALFINCLIDPYLLFTAGGQLTYYLTFMIIMINPLINQINRDYLKPWLFSFVISWLSLPLIWFHFYEWNWLNFILTIVLGPVLFMGLLPILLISFILSFIVPSLSFTSIERCFILLQGKGEVAASWNAFRQVTGKLPTVIIIIVIICQLVWLIEWENKKSCSSMKMNLLVLLTFLIPFWKFVNPRGMIAFVDVGQGDSIFLQLPFHRGNYLLDTGGRLNYEREEWQQFTDKRGADYTVIPFMKSKGVKELDAVFISHAHEDHFGDLDRISDNIKVKKLLFGEGSYEQKNFKKMLTYKQIKQTKKEVISSKNSWQRDGITANCLYPLTKGDGQNNDSVVLKLQIKDQSILLMGDLEKEGENELLKYSPGLLQADILKAGHHGSNTSSQENFLDIVKPTEAIISCGQNNHYNHPSKETLEHFEDKNIQEFRTDEQGMIYYTWSMFSKKLSKGKYIKD